MKKIGDSVNSKPWRFKEGNRKAKKSIKCPYCNKELRVYPNIRILKKIENNTFQNDNNNKPLGEQNVL